MTDKPTEQTAFVDQVKELVEQIKLEQDHYDQDWADYRKEVETCFKNRGIYGRYCEFPPLDVLVNRYRQIAGLKARLSELVASVIVRRG